MFGLIIGNADEESEITFGGYDEDMITSDIDWFTSNTSETTWSIPLFSASYNGNSFLISPT
jgi:hypothetical protein